MTLRLRRFALAVVVLLTTSACSASAPTAPPATATTTGTTTATATTATTATATTAATPATVAPTTKAPTATRTCSGNDVAVSATEASGGVGHGGLILVFTNQSASPCALLGYPGAAGVDAAGAQVVQATRTLTGYLGGCRCSAPQSVILVPRQQGSSLLEGDTGGGNECLVVTSVLVTPPDTTTSTPVAQRVDACHLQIHPVVAGASGGAAA